MDPNVQAERSQRDHDELHTVPASGAKCAPGCPGYTGRETKRADQLSRGDWLAAGELTPDPAEILFAEPFTYDAAREVHLVFRRLGIAQPSTDTLLASGEFELATAAELAAWREQGKRAERIAEIRQLADWLEANPDVPMPYGVGGQADIGTGTAADVAAVREFAARFGGRLKELDDRTVAYHRIGDVEYALITWHRDGRPAEAPKPLISDETIAEAAAMEERDRDAGGFPWEVPGHPENSQPGGWHHGQLDRTGLAYSRADDEPDDPAPVSPARVPAHTGDVESHITDDGRREDRETPVPVAVHDLVDETDSPAEICPKCSQPIPAENLFDHLLHGHGVVALADGRFARECCGKPEDEPHETFCARYVPPTDPADLPQPVVHVSLDGSRTACGWRLNRLPEGQSYVRTWSDPSTCLKCADEAPF